MTSGRIGARVGWPRGLTLILGIAFLVLGMALSIGPAAEERLSTVLEARGVEETATVTDKTIRSGGRGRSRYAVLDVQFITDIGYEEAGLIYCGEPEDYDPGDEIEVIYDPEDPTNVNFTQCHRVQELSWLVIVGVVALVVGSFFILRTWHSSGWKRGRLIGIPLALIGAIFVGASFDQDCECKEVLYFGASMALIGAVGAIGPGGRAAPVMPPTATRSDSGE